MRSRVLSTCLAISGLLVGCGGDDSGGDEQGPPDAFVGGGAGGGEGGAGGGGEGGMAGGGGGEERVRMSFVRRIEPRDGGSLTNDLVVFDIQDGVEHNLTAGLDGEVDCGARLCALNASMTTLGWLQRGDSGRFSLFVAPVEVTSNVEDMRVLIDQKREVDTDVISFAFTGDDVVGDLVVYSRGTAAGAQDLLDVIAVPVTGEDEAACPSIEEPYKCKQIVGSVNVNGGFKVGSRGRVVIRATTDLSSMTIGFTNLVTGAQQDLYIFGEMGGTGSMFSGTLPIGLSPDGSYLAVFTDSNFMWRMNILQVVPNPPPPEVIDLFESPTNPDGTCARQAPFNFNQVRFDPRFTANGEQMFFLATGDCSIRNTAGASRDDFDILSVDPSTPSTDAIANITNNPRANHWSNHSIQYYDLSPDGSQVAFIAPREFDIQSHSIWVMDVESGEFDCTQGTSSPGIDGRDRCEFVSGEVQNASVKHRNLQYHTVTAR
ncbi:MAG: hypothetical protein ACE366_25720 [Bradymonadia bacterium]